MSVSDNIILMSTEQSRIRLWRTLLDPFLVIGRYFASVKGKRSVSLCSVFVLICTVFLRKIPRRIAVWNDMHFERLGCLSVSSDCPLGRALHESACVCKFCPTPHALFFPCLDSLRDGNWYLTPTSATLCYTDISDVDCQEYFSKGNFGDLVFI